jgi:hypothetical protein
VSTPDWTASSRIKIKRAKQHINDLEAAINAWGSGEPSPYELVEDFHEQAGSFIGDVRVREIVPPDPEWGAIFGDAVHNLSAALDTLIHGMVLARGERPNQKLSFQIFDGRPKFEKAGISEITRAGKAAVNIYKAAEPYKGGNSPLWLIRRLDEQDKHRVLVPIGIGFRMTGMGSLGVFLRQSAGSWEPLEDGAVLYRTQSNVDPRIHFPFPMNMGPQHEFSIALSKSEVVAELEPIGPLLHQAADFIERFVTAFAAAVVIPSRRRLA